MKNISFKLIFRSWWHNKTFTIISILSLAVGIACTNLLAAFVIHEYNIEPDNPNKDKIIVTKQTIVDKGLNFFIVSSEITPQLSYQVPELDKACIVHDYDNITYCKAGENFFTDIKVIESDSSFFQFFPQKAVMGSLENAMAGPDRVVLTESFSKRLFGRNDPIGQTIQLQFGISESMSKVGLFTFTVSAVVKNNNHQAAFNFDALFFDKPTNGANFFLLKDNISISNVQAKTTDLIIKNHNDIESKYEFFSIREACLDQVAGSSLLKKTNTNLLLIALFSAILILAIACFNYINLSFSRVFKQLYSIHVQKLMGAGSRQLSMQLFADTFMTVCLGFLIAQLIQFDLLSVMNRIMSVRVPGSFLYSNQVLPVTFGLILLLACIPALYMSRRLPEMSISMYNNFYRGKARRWIITSLAVTQFVISFVLIIGSFSVRRQVSLLYDKVENYKNVYTFSVGDYETSMLPLKERIAHLPGIQAVTLDNGFDYWPLSNSPYEPYSSEDGDEEIMEVMGYKLLQGLPWKEALAEYPHPVYLNRTWAQNLFPDGNIPIGHLINEYEPRLKDRPPFGNDHVIAGVVEDYFKLYASNSLETPVNKSIISYTRDGINLKVRIDPGNTTAIQQIYEEWNKLFPGKYLEHESLYANVLGNNNKLFELSDLLMMYSIISILLTCFGLFGMSLYAIEQRTKEIGIRKVNGSSIWQIMIQLNCQFIIWIGIAYVIAVPVIWLMINQWMESFVYRAKFSLWTYSLSLFIVIVITLLTVSWHSYRAASGNPVHALKDE
ncbi:MAG: ABC transporter permease [Tannerella sp.]|jgi:ABC-type antimicrobial peptide transport system permease subunit|nr:ABC transporter permease [Tannerella sp.]